jgi:hypothetical protein
MLWRRRVLSILAVLLPLALTGRAAAAPPPTAVVSMGDSYISGEGGRWLGNSPDNAGSRDGTDRACVFTLGLCSSYDESRVYLDGTAADGCHRSDVAEVRSARLAVDRRINIACSGGVSSDLYRSTNGGTSAHGEPPQADQLLPIARQNRVRMIVVSVGGNDLGFASIVQACFTAYEEHGTPCSQTEAYRLTPDALAVAQAKVAKAIDEIRAVMRQAGYADGDYRLVLQTYPSVIPRASDARYLEADPERTVYGCPFYDVDMTWGHDVAAPAIGSMVKAAAASRGVATLDLRSAFQGHEFCSVHDAAVSPLAPPSASTSEWGRALSSSTITQGESQEVFHPDAFGQQALGDCLGLLYAAHPGSYTCAGAPGITPDQMTLGPATG